jgi:hypothetical protein
MAMENEQEFSLNKKTKMIATEIFDKTPYIKKAHSYIPQSQLEGKKYGNVYTVYIPDPGKTRIAKASSGKDGLEAKIDPIQEVEYVIETKAGLNDCELTEWNKLGDVESFKNEIVKVRGVNVARSIEKEAIESTIWRSAQVGYIGELDLDAIGLGSAGLDEASVAGDKVTFIAPKLGAKLAKKALGAFNQQDIARDLYRDKYLGTYAESAVVTESFMPTVTANSAHTASIKLVAVTDATGTIGFKPVSSITGTATAGDVFKLDGLKLVDVNGIQTEQDYFVVVGKDGEIPEIRIEIEGKSCNNANAWMPASTTAGDKSLTYALENGKKYAVVQTRTQSALGFDAYEFGEIPGTKMAKETYDGLTVQCYEGGNLGNFSSLVRIVVPFAAGIPDPRTTVLSYVEV